MAERSHDELFWRKALGENIRKIRKRTKLTQDAFSEKIGIEPSSLSNIENGKSFPSALTIIQIQQQFEISPDEIFDADNLKTSFEIEREILQRIDLLPLDKKQILWKILRAI